MKEKLYTIPVNDAYASDCECPICKMYGNIEQDAIEFTMGPSYMEDDIRMVTDKKGFCSNHITKLYRHQNRLGLALMLDTHIKRTINEFEKIRPASAKAPSLFKKASGAGRIEWLKEINNSCYICDRISGTFERYIATIFYLYSNDKEFASKIKGSKGLCSKHFTLLYDSASVYLGGSEYQEFLSLICEVFIDNLKRVEEELEWFTDKFDYRNADAPWKNSKDALPRTIIKTNSTFVE